MYVKSKKMSLKLKITFVYSHIIYILFYLKNPSKYIINNISKVFISPSLKKLRKN